MTESTARPDVDPAAKAHQALDRIRWIGPLIGVVVCAAALTAVGIWTIAKPLALPTPLIAGVSLALFIALEIGVRRSGRTRQAPAKRLMHALVDQVNAPEVGSMRGLPMLRGLVGTRAFALTVDSAPDDRLRLGLTISAQPRTPVFLASKHPVDFPEKLVTKLLTRRGYVVFDADGDTLCAIALQPDVAHAAYDIDALRPVLDAQAPHCVTLDGGFETLRWDTMLTDAITPEMIVDLVTTLPARFEVTIPGIDDVEPPTSPDESAPDESAPDAAASDEPSTDQPLAEGAETVV